MPVLAFRASVNPVLAGGLQFFEHRLDLLVGERTSPFHPAHGKRNIKLWGAKVRPRLIGIKVLNRAWSVVREFHDHAFRPVYEVLGSCPRDGFRMPLTELV